jgi:hypothetical protein
MKTRFGAGAVAALLAASPAFASSHREAPLISEDPTADSTDVYMFLSPDVPDTVTLIANYIPLEEPSGGPNFHRFSDSVLYELKIDNTGDAVEDIVYQFRFKTAVGNGGTFLYNTGNIAALNDPDLNVVQTYDVTRLDLRNGAVTATTEIATGLRTPPAHIGPQSTGGDAAYEAIAQAAITTVNVAVNGGGAAAHTLFAGVRDEGFYLDLGAIFDLINITRIDLGNPDAQLAVDYTAGFNVHSIALQVPITALTSDGQLHGQDDPEAVIGFWTAASRQKHTVLRKSAGPDFHGDFVQVSRLGLPLINEVVIPLSDKDKFNRTSPKDDVTNFGAFVLDPELSRILNALFGITIPAAPRNDMLAVISFLPGLLTTRADLQPADLLRLNVGIAPVAGNVGNRLGVIGGDLGGFPNGRRVTDDTVDILERVVGGGILAGAQFNVFPNNALNDGVIQNDKAFLPSFPYLATPHRGFDRVHQ